MANYAEIVGEEVRFYDRQLLDAKPLEDVLARYQPPTTWMTDRLPANTVYIGNQHNHTLYVVEQPPRMVTLRMAYGSDAYREQREPHYDHDEFWPVPVPWEYYAVSIADKPSSNEFGDHWRGASTLYVYWSDHPVTDPNEKALVTATLPNISKDASVCLGGTSADSQEPYLMMSELVEDFYGTHFNSDLGITSGPTPDIATWLWHGNDLNQKVDLTHRDFRLFREACNGSGAMSIIDILRGKNTKQVPSPSLARMPATPAAFLTEVFGALPSPHQSRLAGMLQDALTRGTTDDPR